MKLTISKEDYVKAIAEADAEEGAVIAATIARWLQVSPSAVALALRRLRRDKLVTVDRKGVISLTPEGRGIADKLRLRHHLVERMLHELLEQLAREEQAINLEKVRAEIAASIACHAAIKVNTPLECKKMEWLLRELGQTDCPMCCPHGRPVVLRYSVRDIQRAFKRI